MTAENMVRHRLSPNYPFWQMLKAGWDNFEVTKRPPDVEVCEKKYVFNQQSTKGEGFNASGKCPADMSTPPALQVALAGYGKQYQADYDTFSKKYDGMAWYDPSEAERKAVVAKKRAGHDLAYAPTGTSLAAGKMMKVADLEGLMAKQSGQLVASGATPTTVTADPSIKTGRVGAPAAIEAAPAGGPVAVATALPANVPIPTENPLAYAAAPPVETAQAQPSSKPPFWKFWSR
jgi:hypothetical protein